MPFRSTTRRTSRFIDRWLWLSVAALGLVAVAGILSLTLPEILVNQQIRIGVGTTGRLAAMPVAARAWGALRINVRAQLPRQSWVAFEIQILDEGGNLLGSALKQAWRGGQGGPDTIGMLDLRPERARNLVLAIAVLDAGQLPANRPVAFSVRVTQGEVDGRYLLAGFLGCTALVVLTTLACRFTGTPIVARTVADSEVHARAILGGRQVLVRATATVETDESGAFPSATTLTFQVRDAWGERVYFANSSGRSATFLDWGRSNRQKQRVEWLLILQERGSYGFSIVASPEDSVEYVSLTVREGARTALPDFVTTVTKL